MLTDTIAAISTGSARAAIGILRLSGPQACSIAQACLRFSVPSDMWPPRVTRLADLLDSDQSTIDRVLATYFQAPHSYTGEDVVEISCHGAPVILQHGLQALCRQGARLAQPGEFTLRAYLHGRIDLPQAEAIRDLIEADTIKQARVALQQSQGSLSKAVSPAKEQLIDLVALLEAGIDFVEQGVPTLPDAEALSMLRSIRQALQPIAASYRYGARLRQGVSMALIGPPNAGKSSLFNRLLGHERAIVTEIAGTTRDTIAETFDLDGVPVRLLDTAGLRDSAGRLEQLGMERTRQAMVDADVVLLVLDRSVDCTEEERRLLTETESLPQRILVLNKCDLPVALDLAGLAVSALTGEGIDVLRARLRQLLGVRDAGEGSAIVTNLRPAQLLECTLESLSAADALLTVHESHEIVLEDLQSALRSLGELSGATTPDDVLHRIFATFCIGK